MWIYIYQYVNCGVWTYETMHKQWQQWDKQSNITTNLTWAQSRKVISAKIGVYSGIIVPFRSQNKTYISKLKHQNARSEIVRFICGSESVENPFRSRAIQWVEKLHHWQLVVIDKHRRAMAIDQRWVLRCQWWQRIFARVGGEDSDKWWCDWFGISR